MNCLILCFVNQKLFFPEEGKVRNNPIGNARKFHYNFNDFSHLFPFCLFYCFAGEFSSVNFHRLDLWENHRVIQTGKKNWNK
jgi:hypothetical protein